MTALRAALLAAYEAEDPDRQGVHWPDPIAHDGRPLVAQASDLLATAIADGPLDAALADLQAALVPPERQAIWDHAHGCYRWREIGGAS